MLWLKALHLIFVIAWFAGLFYLPRLFVYHCEVRDEAGQARFCVMEKRLFAITSIGMAGTLAFGIAMLVTAPGYTALPWLQAKLALIAGLVAYHHWLLLPLRAFRLRANRHSPRFFRIINEVPAVFLIAIVLLAVLKPAWAP